MSGRIMSRVFQGPTTLHNLLPWLPIGHPALHWTTGSIKHNKNSSSLKPSVHIGQYMNHCTIPAFRNNHKLLTSISCLSQSPDSKLTLSYPYRNGLKPSKILSSKDLPRYLYKNAKDGQQNSKRQLSLSSLSPQAIVDASPVNLQPYLKLVRLDKPIGTWLLYLPCTWSIALSAPAGHLPDFKMLALFGLGATLMRGAGCIVNDMWDKDFDSRVARTKTRPLACGDLTSFQALCCLGLHLSASLAILLTFNWYSIFLGASSLALVVTYPLMKRYTYWPQAILGMTLNWGVLLSWSAMHGQMELPGLVMYLACVFWTMTYDTIYSHQDKEDDMLIGVKSTALKFGEQTKHWLWGFSSVMVGNLALAGLMCDATYPYYMGVGVVAAHLARQIYTVDLNNPADCLAKFKSNKNLGLVLFAFIIASTLLKQDGDKGDKPDVTVKENA